MNFQLELVPREPATKEEIVSNSNPSPEIPTHVILKVLGFSLLIIFVPVSIYFWSLENLYGGSALYAAITAVVATNVILFLYTLMAYYDKEDEEMEKKTQ